MLPISSAFCGPARITTPRRGDGREDITVAEWSPLVDITEDHKEFLIKAELPEVKKGDVKVRVEDGVLYISGPRNFFKEDSPLVDVQHALRLAETVGFF